jgi:hypothetical protein
VSEYIASPRAVAAPFEPIVVALTAATTKTVLQVATPTTTMDIRILGWGVSFDGTSGTGVPVIAHLIDTGTVAATVTSLTPDNWGNPLAPLSLCVGGVSATGYNASVEGTITAARLLDSQHVHPQSGYGVWFPEVRIQPRVPVNTILRIRCKAPAGVNVLPWIVWAEPSI